MSQTSMNRRSLLAIAAVGTVVAAAPVNAKVATKRPKFLWGTAGAAYQIEGSNIGSDIWVVEHIQPKLFKEASGDANDTYHRYAEDIALAAKLGFNTHRFSIEWARIEPEQGQISEAAISYYRGVIETIRRHGMTPFVVLNHFTVPRWFAAKGGFTKPANVEAFVSYCKLITERLGDLYSICAIFNEPNLSAQLAWGAGFEKLKLAFGAGNKSAGVATGSPDWASPVLSDWKIQQPIMIDAHNRAFDAIKAASSGRMEVGSTLSIPEQRGPATGPSGVERKLSEFVDPWLQAKGDFVGLQNYTYSIVGRDIDLPYPEGIEMTQMNYPLAPESLAGAIRMIAKRTKKPIYVSEHGVATLDDKRRVYLIDNAIKGLFDCMREGIDVRGYLHWSLLDNYEWFFGYTPKFGLVEVDRKTFKRTPKPSAAHLGRIAKKGLPAGIR